LKVKEIDEKIHNLFHELLILGEDDPKQKNSVHLKTGMTMHQERILAIKENVKPGFISMFRVPFEKAMIKSYLMKVKIKTIEPDGESLKRSLVE